MLIIPAIDLYDGRCVRLYQGKLEEQTVFSENPMVIANQWQTSGAQLLHIVDLNGAFDGNPSNLKIVFEIAKTINVPIQLGGGIRTRRMVENIFANGVQRVVLGTTAITNPDLVCELAEDFPNRIVLGIDANDGMVAVKGWTEVTYQKATALAARFNDLPLAGIVFTDIKRDGTLAGPNLASLREMTKSTRIPVISSGGIGSIDDIGKVAGEFSNDVSGIIVGRALYTGDVNLKSAIEKYQI